MNENPPRIDGVVTRTKRLAERAQFLFKFGYASTPEPEPKIAEPHEIAEQWPVCQTCGDKLSYGSDDGWCCWFCHTKNLIVLRPPIDALTLPDNERDYWPECDTEPTFIIYDKWHGPLVLVNGVELYVNRAVMSLFGACGMKSILIRPVSRDWTILTDEDVQEIHSAGAEWKRW